MGKLNYFLGYDMATWEDMYRFYVFSKEQEPQSIWEVRKFWLEQMPLNPDDTMKVALRLSEAYNKDIDVSKISGMIYSFLRNNKDCEENDQS